MNVILLFLLSSLALANVFQLKETSSRFILEIRPDVLFFESESLQKKFVIRPCNENLAKTLNAELLALLPDTKIEKGISFEVDKRLFNVAPGSELGKRILAMGPRILRFTLEEYRACK
jgi:hypothetical protein